MILRAVFLASAVLLAPMASPALAQSTAAPAPAKANVTAGAAVLDPQGGTVGTVASVSGELAVVDTGAVKASLPVSAFAQGDKGLLISMTKTELEAAAKGAAQGSQAELAALLVPGTAVTDSKGGAVGKIDSVEGEFAIVATPSAKVKLPKTAFAKGPNGPIIGMTLAELEAAAKGAAPKS